MLNILKFSLLALGFVFLGTSTSQASRISIVATGDEAKYNYSLPAGTTADTASSKIGYGGGILLDYGMMHRVGLQVGALYITRTQNLDAPELVGTNRVTQHLIQVPVTLQFHLLPYVTISAGGYWAAAIGDNSVMDSTGNNATTASNSSLNQKTSDYGFQGGAAIHIPLTQRTSFLIDGRYVFGMDNQVADGSYTKKTRDIQGMVGFSFAMMGNR